MTETVIIARPNDFRYSDIRMQKSEHEKSWETQRQEYYQEFWIKYNAW